MIVIFPGLDYVGHHRLCVVVLLKSLASDLNGVIEDQNAAEALSVIDSDVLESRFFAMHVFDILVYF